jgi:hypothetical protein
MEPDRVTLLAQLMILQARVKCLEEMVDSLAPEVSERRPKRVRQLLEEVTRHAADLNVNTATALHAEIESLLDPPPF